MRKKRQRRKKLREKGKKLRPKLLLRKPKLKRMPRKELDSWRLRDLRKRLQ